MFIASALADDRIQRPSEISEAGIIRPREVAHVTPPRMGTNAHSALVPLRMHYQAANLEVRGEKKRMQTRTDVSAARIIRPREVAQRLGVSSTTLWRYAKRPDFPRAFRLGPNAVGFDSGELETWIAARRVAAA